MASSLQLEEEAAGKLETIHASAMAKSKKKTDVVDSTNLPILELLSLKAPIFQSLLHPELPIIITVFGTGHIVCHRYDPAKLQSHLDRRRRIDTATTGKDAKKGVCPWIRLDIDLETGDLKLVDIEEQHHQKQTGKDEDLGVKTLWKTKRHKGSVRAMCFDSKGDNIFSVGSDNVLKKANTMTGKVVKKVNLSSLFNSEEKKNDKFTKLCASQTHPFILIGDESGNIHVINSENLALSNSIRSIHFGDSINDIFHFDKRSAYKFISLGQTTLAYFDVRDKDAKPNVAGNEDGKILISDDQEDEVLCGCFVDPEVADTLLCGMGEGIVTVWKPNKNDLEDQMSRIKISKDESIDCIVPTLQDDNCVWCGCSNGNIYKVNAKLGKVVEVRNHSELDEVSFVDLDFEYRVVSGGLENIKIWELSSDDVEENASVESDSDEPLSHSDEDLSDDTSSDDETTLVGLSKEGLLDELDKDLKEDHQEEKESNSKSVKKRKIMKENNKKKDLYEHGIKKFDDL
ncbi:CPS_HP_G0138420.mRNA.1.CDS.1 [Saccharomyces cerevisiae]|nr:CPS_HP_G0047450.mRNA.1.CDS.1 [Saccharomyces cerevisiae]CAI5029810.1 CPS_HP_G0101180.mRNA.1.CDS.1 [Saccharomyces cerevisiae]CAI5136453.1 CPS_HP_G0138420.mRNA.1.CDS.1 [Saccharomyces cerevisiae]CAI6696452.1 CPS_HP_G0047450.mRNA.1.CDS.1 [Saccharomyces cerevisiae]CAI6947253.1 CPS_HP_G0101180.mRNA.1.CDS.1 [Saccharomyces cerevisiae]